MALGIIAFMANTQMGPVWAMLQSVSPTRMRATGAACFQLLLQLIGMGLGPLLAGYLSDQLSGSYGQQSIRYAMFLLPLAALGSSAMLLLASRFAVADIKRAAVLYQLT